MSAVHPYPQSRPDEDLDSGTLGDPAVGSTVRPDLNLRILGPLEIRVAGAIVSLTGAREQRLVAMLLLAPNAVVPLQALVDAVWVDSPPPTAKRQVQNRMSALRQRLGDLIVGDGPGYRAQVGPGELDAEDFQRLVAQARAPGTDLDTAARLLSTALALWRGPALAGLTGHAIESGAVALDECRLVAHERYVDVLLDLGRHAEVVGDLSRLVAANPLRERPVGQLMLALHRSGRTAEALQVFDQLRCRLADELGIDPSQEISHLRTLVLRDEALPISRPPTDVVIPRQLPAAPRHFVGRVSEVARLGSIAGVRALASRPMACAGDNSTAVAVISGPAAIGKTVLALHWAHLVAERFPDGQLYVDLRGFDPTGAALHPAVVLREFLYALRPEWRVPAAFDAQVGLYRSLLAGRRILVLLDNARDADQVRPLLPAAPGCVAIVTSRNELTSLVTADGAETITLDLLTSAEARQLLARRVGQEVVDAEPAVVSEIIMSCGRLPLALALVAARASVRRDFPLSALADRLRQARGGLDAFRSEDPRADLRAVFSWSYQVLSQDAARLFRLLGLHDGPDIGLNAAASLAGLSVPRTRALLAELANANLATEGIPGRYACHDLLHAYAGELVKSDQNDAERTEARLRLLSHYLHTGYAAALLVRPSRNPITLPEQVADATAEYLADRWAAQTWFAAEHLCLVAAIDQAAAAGHPDYAWRLAWTLVDILDRRGQWHSLKAVQHSALAAAEEIDDHVGRTSAHHSLARAQHRLGELDGALANFEAALAIHRELGEQTRQMHVMQDLSNTLSRQGRHQEALWYAERGLIADGTAVEQANGLNAIGLIHAYAGNYEEALPYCQRAERAAQTVDEPFLNGAIADTLAYVHHHLGQYPQAIDCYQRAVRLVREVDDHHTAAQTLVRLGETQRAAGQPDAAARSWREALDILDPIDPIEAASVREKLDDLEAPVK